MLFSASADLSIAVFDIGRSLREARENRGLSPEDVQKSLNIRERYLTALEEERWELLPGEAYTKGFLRTYAEFLGLNGTLYIDEFNERIAVQEDEPIVPESLAPRRGRSNLLTRSIVGIFVLAFVVFAASAWRPGSSAAPSVEAAGAAPSKPVAIPVKPVVLHKPGSKPKAHPKPKLAIVRAVNGRSWFSVRIGGPNGKEIFRGFLNRGHNLTYPLHPSVWMRIGRPRAVTIALGHRLVRGLPGTPANLLLTPDGPQAG